MLATPTPTWSVDEPMYLKLSDKDELFFDYIQTWNNPDRKPYCIEFPDDPSK